MEVDTEVFVCGVNVGVALFFAGSSLGHGEAVAGVVVCEDVDVQLPGEVFAPGVDAAEVFGVGVGVEYGDGGRSSGVFVVGVFNVECWDGLSELGFKPDELIFFEP